MSRPAVFRQRPTSKAILSVLLLGLMLCVGAAVRAAHASDADGLKFQTVVGAGSVPLNVVTHGDPSRPAVVLIHGFRQSYISWAAQLYAPELSQYFLVAYDLRGHGNSGVPWDLAAYTESKAWADDLAAVLAAVKVDRAVMVAWSFGGDVLMDYIRHHGDAHISKVMLIGASAHLIATPPPTTPAPSTQPRPTQSASLDDNLGAVRKSVDTVFGNTISDTMRSDYVALGMRTSPYVDRGMGARSVSNADLVSRLKMPLNLVFGAKDKIVPEKDVATLRTIFKSAVFTIYENSGHAPFINEPARFNRELAQFVEAR